MQLLSRENIKHWDHYTIINEPITSIDLMERASNIFVQWFQKNKISQTKTVNIFSGPGNNGGDGLAIARLLRNLCYDVTVYFYKSYESCSNDFSINLEKLYLLGDVPIHAFPDHFNKDFQNEIIIDALFGVGLSRPLDDAAETLVKLLNNATAKYKISIDMPSGMPSDGILIGECFKPDIIFTFQVPKLSFFFKENEAYIQEWITADIGLKEDFLDKIETNKFLIDKIMVRNLVKKRKRHQHKGDFGHAAIVAGGHGKIGAAILSVKACLRSGVGLVTAMVPNSAIEAINISVPEVMTMDVAKLNLIVAFFT